MVNERFTANWTPDHDYEWQKNRGVVGHNLKIVWNLTRLSNIDANSKIIECAKKIGAQIQSVGVDKQRGGWYDVIERTKAETDLFYRFAFHDRKAWWQQEQAILAYLILQGQYPDKTEYEELARESASFYNAWFLDQKDGGVYFNVLANGLPYLLDNERTKGCHAMSGYHSFELCYLAAVYTNLIIKKRRMTFYYRPYLNPESEGILRVKPDLCPGSFQILDACIKVTRDAPGEHLHFNPTEMTVDLPRGSGKRYVEVILGPGSK